MGIIPVTCIAKLQPRPFCHFRVDSFWAMDCIGTVNQD